MLPAVQFFYAWQRKSFYSTLIDYYLTMIQNVIFLISYHLLNINRFVFCLMTVKYDLLNKSKRESIKTEKKTATERLLE